MQIQKTPSPGLSNSVPPKKYYLTNSTLLPEVIKCKESGVISHELAKMLMLLTERYSKKSKFIGYSFREDMVSEALINLCQNALKFDPKKSSNPFSFYTTAIHNSFLQFLNNEKKHRNIRDKILLDLGENPSFNFMLENEGKNRNLSSDDAHAGIPYLSMEDSNDNHSPPNDIENVEEIVIQEEKVKSTGTRMFGKKIPSPKKSSEKIAVKIEKKPSPTIVKGVQKKTPDKKAPIKSKFFQY